MKHMAVPPQEDKCNSKARPLVAVSKPLGTCESCQVGRSQIREIGLGVAGPPVQGSSKRRAHDILVQNPVRSAIPLDLRGVDHTSQSINGFIAIFTSFAEVDR